MKLFPKKQFYEVNNNNNNNNNNNTQNKKSKLLGLSP